MKSDLPSTVDSSGLSEMPGLESSDFGLGPPVYGPHMPGPFSSPTPDSASSYGDVTGKLWKVVINFCFSFVFHPSTPKRG